MPLSTTRTAIAPGQRRRFVVPKLDDPLGLFGDGPPWWTISKGKAWQRPSSTARQAKRQREARAFKLRWHGNHVAMLAGNPTSRSIAALALADKLDRCAPPELPCLSGACPICIRALQRWFVAENVGVLKPLVQRGYQAQALSLVPECGMTRVGSLSTCDIDKFRDAMRQALKACGIVHYKLGLDVSLDHVAGVASPKHWQLQLWGFFHEPKSGWQAHLTALVDPNNVMTRPVQVEKRDSLKATAAYGVKSTFDRRERYWKANLKRKDRGGCWNTRPRILRGEAWVELMLFLDHIGLQRRLLLSSRNSPLQPLDSRNAPRLGGTR
jgi:hypothetical protein